MNSPSNKSLGRDLLDSLENVDWRVAAKVYGNDHATLIGVLVAWWIREDPEKHWVLEGGLSYDTRSGRGGKGGGRCDAVFCKGANAVGVLEVEGSRPSYTVDKTSRFLGTKKQYLDSLSFAVLLLYGYEPKGRGVNRHVPTPARAEILSRIKEVSGTYPQKPIIVIVAEKSYKNIKKGIRSWNDYYKCSLHSVRAFLYQSGEVAAKVDLYEDNSRPRKERTDSSC